MSGWRAWLPRLHRGEGGFSEAATAIFVLPLLALLIFMLIETGWNIRYRLLLDNIVSGATRGVALDGANCNPKAGCKNASQSWSSKITTQIDTLCGTGSTARCKIVTPSRCTPQSLATKVGDTVKCTVTVSYTPLTAMASNPVSSLGFSTLLTADITTTVESAAGVGQS